MIKYKDKYNRPVVVVTSMGLITSIGESVEENWKCLISGKSGIKQISRFETANLATKIAGCIENNLACEKGSNALTEYLAYNAITEALNNERSFAGPLFIALPPMELSWRSRFAICQHPTYSKMLDACKEEDYKILYDNIQNSTIPYKLKKIFGFSGCPVALTTACASGATAINMAVNAIRYNKCNKALAVAADGSITPELITRFSLLGALSKQNEEPTKASKPFMENRSGFVMAEGAAALVLETLDSALKNNKNILATISGCGESTDTFHRTRSSPDNKAAIKAIRIALKDADLEPKDINHINAHATSTIENDKAEYQTLQKIFGEYLEHISVTANKSMLGHCLSAAGAIEAVIAILSLHHSLIPPTINYDKLDSTICLNIVANKSRSQNIQHVLSNSFGFGGQNSCLIFSKF